MSGAIWEVVLRLLEHVWTEKIFQKTNKKPTLKIVIIGGVLRAGVGLKSSVGTLRGGSERLRRRLFCGDPSGGGSAEACQHGS